MREVYMIGIGQVPVTKNLNHRGRYLARDAIQAAMASAAVDPNEVTALYVGNMMASILGQQTQLGALYAHAAGLGGIEAMTVEAACGSGGAAARLGYIAVAGGVHDVVVVCGLERMTHADRDATTRALATAADWELEGCVGESFISLNAKLMSYYMEAYKVGPQDFAPFAITAHRNAMHNANALLHKPIDIDGYLSSRMLVEPVRLMDAPPTCDGSAAVVLTTREIANSQQRTGSKPIRVRASAVGTDYLAVAQRPDKLWLHGAELAARRAYDQAGVGPQDIDIFELHDAYTVITALSLEAAGFAKRGQATALGKEGRIGTDGDVPIATMGGLKARGHPVGATGVYQLVETYLQLTDNAGENQVPNPRLALVQNIGGTGATVVSHILERV
jgi:acetyl-CoA C-acetyltransferase